MVESKEWPYNLITDEKYIEILNERSQQISTELPELFNRAHYSSCRALVMDTYGDDCILDMKLSPVRIMNGIHEAEPVLIAYCQWCGYIQTLYWSINTKEIFFKPEEVEYIYKMVKDDDFYFQTGIWD
ncbi:MAG: hypothetical protein UR61_C0053G0005 [candidate division WS6 bacterium GW2011_GWE1_34_7]|uniref:Uncharacterized protein n=1 Tax=candidate division WS6 bacterium GW2011_GWE1_34_7 TaxID=1619093 RepID=A0A0G0B404_9BACT|nr:MAG: hypothetical protein UR61_C0053G0005 [candidate division WS6 bacterium GW2011_GWE1_34_7]